MKSQRRLVLERPFIRPFILCVPGMRSMIRSWADLTPEEGANVLARANAIGQVQAFAEIGLMSVRRAAPSEFMANVVEAINAIETCLETPIDLSAEAAEILGTMADGLTFRQLAAIQSCSIALDIIEKKNDGWSLAKIGRSYGEEANIVRNVISGLGHTSSADYTEENILRSFSQRAGALDKTMMDITLRRANFPYRDWGSVVVNNGFKVTDGKLEGEVVEAFGNSRPIDGRWWRVIPVSIPTLEEAIETILEWGCGL